MPPPRDRPAGRAVPAALTTTHEWTLTTIELVTDKGRVRTEAWVLGPVAVHQALDVLLGWSVTSTRTGLLVARFQDRLVAKAVAEGLYRLAAPALSLPTAEAIVNALPQRVKNWVRACRRKGTFVPLPTLEEV